MSAGSRYRGAQQVTVQAMQEQAGKLPPYPDSGLEVRRALDGEKVALAEYREALQIFNDLILRNQEPDGLSRPDFGRHRI